MNESAGERSDERNRAIARIFREIAIYLDMEGVAFKPRAYDRAADTIDGWPESLAEIYEAGGRKALAALPGIGKSAAEKIVEFLESGRVQFYEDCYARMPLDLAGLGRVEGLGPKSMQTLYRELDVTDVESLEAAARSGRIRELSGFGAKSEAKILRSIELLRSQSGRIPRERAEGLAAAIRSELEALPGVRRVEVAGSLRRRKDTVGDLDFLVLADDPGAVAEAFTTLPDVIEVQGKGATKSTVRLRAGIDADLRVVPEESFGAALQYFTGSKDHNVELRKRAMAAGLKINEYGVYRGEEWLAGRSEEEVYAAIGLRCPPPVERLDGRSLQPLEAD